MGWLEREEGWIGPKKKPPKEPEGEAEGEADAPEVVVEREAWVIVKWVPIRCPTCGEAPGTTSGTNRPLPGYRYHRCNHCGMRFRSLEVREIRDTE